ncbi:hypothetical protein KC721_00210, partial [Candidatus Woesebacteria bacterium]|nr:hypothetical protein [Candidatus Woesebacteria bacterium]
MISIPEKIQNSIILILIVAVGLFLRAYKFGYYPLGFDNLQIITSAEKIVEGDLVFLGPRTGPAEMFTGPLIYYVAAPFLFLGFSHYTAIFVPLFLALLTGITLAWLTKVVEREQHLILALWAFSPLLIPMDRILWNPNLTVLASSLTFFPLLALERKYRYQLFGKHIPTEFLLFVGAFLGYQAHFSGLILAPLACIYLVVRRYKNVWLYGALFVGFLASLLPTVLFDIKNNYLNTRGLLSLLEGKTGFGLVGFFTTLLHAMQISLENLGGVLLEGNSLELILIAGVVVVLTTLLLYKKITEKEKKL